MTIQNESQLTMYLRTVDRSMNRTKTVTYVDAFLAGKRIRCNVRRRDLGFGRSRSYRSWNRNWYFIPDESLSTRELKRDPAHAFMIELMEKGGYPLPKKNDRRVKYFNTMTVLSNLLMNILLEYQISSMGEHFSSKKRRSFLSFEERVLSKAQYYCPIDGIGEAAVLAAFSICSNLDLFDLRSDHRTRWTTAYSDHRSSLPSLVVRSDRISSSLLSLSLLQCYTHPHTLSSFTPAPSLSLLRRSGQSPTGFPQELNGSKTRTFSVSTDIERVFEKLQFVGSVYNKPTFYKEGDSKGEYVDPFESDNEDLHYAAATVLREHGHINSQTITYSNHAIPLSPKDHTTRMKVQNEDGEWIVGRQSCTFATLDKGQKNMTRINGQKTVEKDLSSLYPTLFASMTGIDLTQSYERLTEELRGWYCWNRELGHEKTRKIAKGMINSIIVSADLEKTKMSIQQTINFNTTLDGYEGERRPRAESLLIKIFRWHPGLRKAAFSNDWITLMNRHETLLMCNIKNRLMDEDIPYIPCYDAVYVPEQYEERVDNIMNTEYESYQYELTEQKGQHEN